MLRRKVLRVALLLLGRQRLTMLLPGLLRIHGGMRAHAPLNLVHRTTDGPAPQVRDRRRITLHLERWTFGAVAIAQFSPEQGYGADCIATISLKDRRADVTALAARVSSFLAIISRTTGITWLSLNTVL